MIVRNPYCTNTWFIPPSLLKSVDITGMQDSGESDKTKNHSFIAGTKANKKQKQNYNRAQNKPADWLQTDKKPSLTDEQTDTAPTMRANMTTNSRRRIQHIHKRVIKGSGDTWRHSWTESLLTSQIKQNLTWDTHMYWDSDQDVNLTLVLGINRHGGKTETWGETQREGHGYR